MTTQFQTAVEKVLKAHGLFEKFQTQTDFHVRLEPEPKESTPHYRTDCSWALEQPRSRKEIDDHEKIFTRTTLQDEGKIS